MFLLSLVLALRIIPLMQEGNVIILPTDDPDVFNIIYQADMKWNVVVKLFDQRGKKRLDTEIKNSESFRLPINLKGESSGTYVIELSTAAYDLRKEFKYLTLEDQLSQAIQVEYLNDRHIIRLQTLEILHSPISVYIYNENGDRLVLDEIEPLGVVTNRSYNLNGAPATRFEMIIMTSGKLVKRELFTY